MKSCSLLLTLWYFACIETIPDGQEPPQFLECLQDITIVEGSNARLDCKVQGQPKPDIEWWVN